MRECPSPLPGFLSAPQVGPDDLRRNALSQLLVQLTKRDAFYQLRTQEQLGYIVSLFPSSELGVSSIQAVVQSASHSAAHCVGRIDAFVTGALAKLEELSEVGGRAEKGGGACDGGRAHMTTCSTERLHPRLAAAGLLSSWMCTLAETDAPADVGSPL